MVEGLIDMKFLFCIYDKMLNKIVRNENNSLLKFEYEIQADKYILNVLHSNKARYKVTTLNKITRKHYD